MEISDNKILIQFISDKQNKSCSMLVDHVLQGGVYDSIVYAPEYADHRGEVLYNWWSQNCTYEDIRKEDFDEFIFDSNIDTLPIRQGFNFMFKK